MTEVAEIQEQALDTNNADEDNDDKEAVIIKKVTTDNLESSSASSVHNYYKTSSSQSSQSVALILRSLHLVSAIPYGAISTLVPGIFHLRRTSWCQ